MQHFVLAPDKFKGSLSAQQVCDAMQRGLQQRFPDAQITTLPLADGGEGTLDVIEKARPTERKEVTVNDPLFRPITTYFLMEGQTAYIEMAKASGLGLLAKAEQHTMQTSSFGTGQLMAEAMQQGATKILLFIGGSATTDGGIGMAAALGYRFLDEQLRPIIPIGANLLKIRHIIKPQTSFSGINLSVCCDVANPLIGSQGAAAVYAPQKGATPNEVLFLEEGLAHLANLWQQQWGVDISTLAGGGAAGGVGAGAVAFLHGHIVSGIETLLQLTDFEQVAQSASCLVTGEGKIDEQTLQGKLLMGIRNVALAKGIPLKGICGICELPEATWRSWGFDEIIALKTDDLSAEESMQQAAALIEAAMQRLSF